MKHFLASYKTYLRNEKFLLSCASAAILLTIGMIVNFYSGLYATERQSNAVTDLILNNIPVFDVDGIFIYGPFFFWAFTIFLTFKEPKRVPFVAKSVAFFIIIRSIFVSLTHLGPFPAHALIEPPLIFASLFSNGDLFFSGHTGLPFLMALIFWDNRKLRMLFIALAVLFGTIVLLAHLHYSIDVLGAFFITYTIFHLAEIFFKKDKKLFESGLTEL